jgi:flagellar biosynthesis/type III secretory pathway chaperone
LVQHKVPRLLAELLKGQFHLMQEWLRPILSESRANGRDLEQLSGQLQALLQKYQEVEQSLAETQPKDAASG